MSNGRWIPGVVVLLLGVIYFLFDPAMAGWMPKCIFHSVTGLDCPGCGSQRMIHALLHADLKSAFQANALLLLSLPYLIFWLWIEYTPRTHRDNPKYSIRLERWRMKMNSPTAIGIICIIIIAWTILRNLR